MERRQRHWGASLPDQPVRCVVGTSDWSEPADGVCMLLVALRQPSSDSRTNRLANKSTRHQESGGAELEQTPGIKVIANPTPGDDLSLWPAFS